MPHLSKAHICTIKAMRYIGKPTSRGHIARISGYAARTTSRCLVELKAWGMACDKKEWRLVEDRQCQQG